MNISFAGSFSSTGMDRATLRSELDFMHQKLLDLSLPVCLGHSDTHVNNIVYNDTTSTGQFICTEIFHYYIYVKELEEINKWFVFVNSVCLWIGCFISKKQSSRNQETAPMHCGDRRHAWFCRGKRPSNELNIRYFSSVLYKKITRIFLFCIEDAILVDYEFAEFAYEYMDFAQLLSVPAIWKALGKLGHSELVLPPGLPRPAKLIMP